MKHNYYPFRATEDYLSFTFESISEHRIVRKKAEFTAMSENVYNFGFGDVNDDDEIDDLAITDNKDTYAVFATLIQILFDFFKTHENKYVYFRGSTQSRTRMYQIILSKERTNWEGRLIVYGMFEGDTLPFEIDCRFDAFIITTNR